MKAVVDEAAVVKAVDDEVIDCESCFWWSYCCGSCCWWCFCFETLCLVYKNIKLIWFQISIYCYRSEFNNFQCGNWSTKKYITISKISLLNKIISLSKIGTMTGAGEVVLTASIVQIGNATVVVVTVDLVVVLVIWLKIKFD